MNKVAESKKDRKKDRKLILTKIRNKLMERPLSKYELAKKLGSNWDTIRANVRILQDLGIVDVQDQKVVYIHHRNRERDEDTIAGLKVDALMKKKVYTLANKISKEWDKKSEEPIGNTRLQKILVKIADSFKELNIPRAWYLYGKLVLVRVNTEILKEKECNYNFRDEIKDLNDLDKQVKELVRKYSKMPVKKVIHDQYDRYDKKMYLIKEEIENILSSDSFSKKKEQLAKLLYELIFLFELDKGDDFSQDIFGILKDGITIMILKLKERENIPNDLLRIIMYDMFKSLWRILAIYNLYYTLEGDLKFDRSTLRVLFQDKADSHMQDFMDECDNLGINSA